MVVRGSLQAVRDRLRSRLLDLVDRLGAPAPTSGGPHAHARQVGVAFVGCGFVADAYATTIARHPGLRLVGVFDLDAARCAKLAGELAASAYPSLDALLTDPTVEIVVNLTNPASHFVVTRASLEAGKHVYSEKPLALDLTQARDLVELASLKGVQLSAAPCAPLGESLQALHKLVADGAVGRVRVVYAELDDGPVHQMHPDEWRSPSGTPWPWRDEFQVGCTLEHAGYHIGWLVALFGAARSVTAFAATLAPDKHPELAPEACAPDFSVGCIEFESGVVARLTCSIVAPHDHTVRIVGDEGMLTLDEIWHFGAPVRIWRFDDVALRADSYAWLKRHGWARALFGLNGRKAASSPASGWRRRIQRHEMDYMLGVAELAAALSEGRPSRLSAAMALHVNEITLAIARARETGGAIQLSTRL